MVSSTENAKDLKLPVIAGSPDFSVFLLGNVNNYIFTQPYAEIAPLLDMEQPVSLSEQLREISPELLDTAGLYPLELQYHGQILPAHDLLHLTAAPLFLQADGAMGKTTLLRRQPALYLPLAPYQKQIREQLLPDVSSYLLTQLLLKYHYGNAYTTWENCTACEGESASRAFAEMCELLRQSFPMTLMLDGTNEISPDQLEGFVEELAWLMQNGKGLRIILSGRTVPDHAVFSAFERIRVLGIPVHDRDAARSSMHISGTGTVRCGMRRSSCHSPSVMLSPLRHIIWYSIMPSPARI